MHDSRIETEARRIVDKLKDLSAPNSPNKTHFMVEISPHFDALASTKDNDRLFAMLPYKSLCFTSIKDRRRTIGKITAAMPGMDGDMWTLAQQTLSKLKRMTDSDYDSQKFYFTDENE